MRTLFWSMYLVAFVGIHAWAQAAQEAPTLTDLDRAQIEVLAARTEQAKLLVQLDACRAEVGRGHEMIGRLRADRASAELTALEAQLKTAIEARHPGYTFDPKTQGFTRR